jgi:hypothetical protein
MRWNSRHGTSAFIHEVTISIVVCERVAIDGRAAFHVRALAEIVIGKQPLRAEPQAIRRMDVRARVEAASEAASDKQCHTALPLCVRASRRVLRKRCEWACREFDYSSACTWTASGLLGSWPDVRGCNEIFGGQMSVGGSEFSGSMLSALFTVNEGGPTI